MAITQRPVTQAALAEPSGERPRWRSAPSWFLFGELDRNIPAGAHRIMAERAQSRRTVEIGGPRTSSGYRTRRRRRRSSWKRWASRRSRGPDPGGPAQ
jgi:hypothetical protein